MDIHFDPSVYSGPVFVTCLYFAFWYYLLLIKQRGLKDKLRKSYEAKGEVFDRYFGQNEEMLAVDRVVINTQEQMMPFIVSLWLFSVLVSVYYATIFGVLYLALRAIYPMLLGKKVSKVNTKKVCFVTIPCYMIIFSFFIMSVVSIL
tara:strand:- start:25720 stop:26160 length:441 start_codon:yes stop_codon:yes gene_type:complete